MKKTLLLFSLIIFLFSCKTNQVTKLDNKTESNLKGNWKITSVKYPGSDMIKVKSFSIANASCFVGSNWSFVSNNNTGTMALTDTKCTSYESKITWYINKEENLIMKFLDTGAKAKKVTEGFILKVTIQSETTFTLTDKINVGGKLTDIIYQFEKNI